MAKFDVILWGATGHSRVLNEALSSDYSLVALVDNRHVPRPMDNIPLLLGNAELSLWLSKRKYNNNLYGAIAIGGNNGYDRLLLLNQIADLGIKKLTIIHPTAFIASDASIGLGSQVLAQAAVCTNVTLGDAVIINTAASVDHDCIIEDGVHVAPGARLAGEVIVRKFCFIGTGAIILPRVTIGENTVIGAGAVVTKDVPANSTMIGCPARNLKPSKINGK